MANIDPSVRTPGGRVLLRFGSTALRKITNSDVLTAREAVFALRQSLEAAIADGRLLG